MLELTEPTKPSCVIVSVGYGDQLRKTLSHNVQLVDQLIVVTSSQDRETLSVCEKTKGVTVVASDRCYDDEAAFNKGNMINDGLARIDSPAWIILTDADIFLNPNLQKSLATQNLNPDYLYYTSRYDAKDEHSVGELFRRVSDSVGGALGINSEPNGYFQLWHRTAPPFVAAGQR